MCALQILYADLIRVAVAPSNLDPFFLAFVITAVVIFAVEITLSSLCRPGYFFRCVLERICSKSFAFHHHAQ